MKSDSSRCHGAFSVRRSQNGQASPLALLNTALAMVMLAFSPMLLAQSPSPAGASVSFGNLQDGATVANPLQLEFVISGMGIAPAGTEIDNTGHHHLLIDVAELPPLDVPLPATDNIRHFGKGQTSTELELTPGEHTLQLLFADYTHTPHEPPVMSKKITITVSDSAQP